MLNQKYDLKFVDDVVKEQDFNMFCQFFFEIMDDEGCLFENFLG